MFLGSQARQQFADRTTVAQMASPHVAVALPKVFHYTPSLFILFKLNVSLINPSPLSFAQYGSPLTFPCRERPLRTWRVYLLTPVLRQVFRLSHSLLGRLICSPLVAANVSCDILNDALFAETFFHMEPAVAKSRGRTSWDGHSCGESATEMPT